LFVKFIFEFVSLCKHQNCACIVNKAPLKAAWDRGPPAFNAHQFASTSKPIARLQLFNRVAVEAIHWL